MTRNNQNIIMANPLLKRRNNMKITLTRDEIGKKFGDSITDEVWDQVADILHCEGKDPDKIQGIAWSIEVEYEMEDE